MKFNTREFNEESCFLIYEKEHSQAYSFTVARKKGLIQNIKSQNPTRVLMKVGKPF